MYRSETVDVMGSPMPVLVFEPEGKGPHPGLVIAQHLPVAHAGLENDPFQIKAGERYAAAGYACAMPFLFHWWPVETVVDVKRAEFRDDRTVADLSAAFALLQKRGDCRRRSHRHSGSLLGRAYCVAGRLPRASLQSMCSILWWTTGR